MINNLSIGALILLAAGTIFFIWGHTGDRRDSDQVKRPGAEEQLKH